MKFQRIADAVTVLIADPSVCRLISRKDLAVIEGVLMAVAKWAHDELERRDKAV